MWCSWVIPTTIDVDFRNTISITESSSRSGSTEGSTATAFLTGNYTTSGSSDYTRNSDAFSKSEIYFETRDVVAFGTDGYSFDQGGGTTQEIIRSPTSTQTNSTVAINYGAGDPETLYPSASQAAGTMGVVQSTALSSATAPGVRIVTVPDAAFSAWTTVSTETAVGTETTSTAIRLVTWLSTSSAVSTTGTFSTGEIVPITSTARESRFGGGTLATVVQMQPGYAAWVCTASGSGLAALSEVATTATRFTLVPEVLSSRSYSHDVVSGGASSDGSLGSSTTFTLRPSSSGTIHTMTWESQSVTVATESNVLPTPTQTFVEPKWVITTQTCSQPELTTVIGRNNWVPVFREGAREVTCDSTISFASSAVTTTRLGTSSGLVTTCLTTASGAVTSTSYAAASYNEGASRQAGNTTITEYTTGVRGVVSHATSAAEDRPEWRGGFRIPGQTGSAVYTALDAALPFTVVFPPATAVPPQVVQPYPITRPWLVSGTYRETSIDTYALAGLAASISATRSRTVTTSDSVTTGISMQSSSASALLEGIGSAPIEVPFEYIAPEVPFVHGGPPIAAPRSATLGRGIYRSGATEVSRITAASTVIASPEQVKAFSVAPLYSTAAFPSFPTIGPLSSTWQGSSWIPFSYLDPEGGE